MKTRSRAEIPFLFSSGKPVDKCLSGRTHTRRKGGRKEGERGRREEFREGGKMGEEGKEGE